MAARTDDSPDALAAQTASLATLQRHALEAQQRGDLVTAAACLGRYVTLDPRNIEALHALGLLCGQIGRHDDAVVAFRRALRLQPLDARSIWLLGNALDRAGAFEAAAAAASLLESKAPGLLKSRSGDGEGRLALVLGRWREQMRARAISAARAAFPDADFDRVAGARWRPDARRLAGERRRPAHFHVPGLADRPWHERGEFAWAASTEAAAPDLARELEGALDLQRDTEPYIAADLQASETWKTLAGRKDWGALHLFNGGRRNDAALARFPRLAALLAALPLTEMHGRPVEALLSVLLPGTHIPPHHGIANHRLTVHLPLVVPDRCSVTVAGETRPAEAGKLLIFDDSFEHSAANSSTRPRIVLIFEIWQPELSAAERLALTGMLEAGDRFDRARRDLVLEPETPGAGGAP